MIDYISYAEGSTALFRLSPQYLIRLRRSATLQNAISPAHFSVCGVVRPPVYPGLSLACSATASRVHVQANIFARVSLFEANGNVLRYYSEHCKIRQFVSLHSFAGLAYSRRPARSFLFRSADRFQYAARGGKWSMLWNGKESGLRDWCSCWPYVISQGSGLEKPGQFRVYGGRNLNSLPPTIC